MRDRWGWRCFVRHRAVVPNLTPKSRSSAAPMRRAPKIARANRPRNEKPSTLISKMLGSGDVLLTRAFPRARPAARAGLTIYVARLPSARPLTASGVPPRRASSRRAARKCKSPAEIPSGAFSSGDVLLSHGLSPYYHRGCSVSLPCSEWERVGPLRYDHQN